MCALLHWCLSLGQDELSSLLFGTCLIDRAGLSALLSWRRERVYVHGAVVSALWSAVEGLHGCAQVIATNLKMHSGLYNNKFDPCYTYTYSYPSLTFAALGPLVHLESEQCHKKDVNLNDLDEMLGVLKNDFFLRLVIFAGILYEVNLSIIVT